MFLQACLRASLFFVERIEKARKTPLLDKHPAGQYNKNERAILYYPEMSEYAIWFTEKEILIKKMVEIIIGSLH